MSGRTRYRFLTAIAAVAALALTVLAAGLSGPAMAGDVPVPAPAKAAGEACVADADHMRRYHMTILKHQRDDTVHDGIRSEKFALTGCIGCHAVKGDDAKPVKISDARHFCRSCHDYAAVKVDCFECHSSVPETKDSAAKPAADMLALSDYLKGRKQ